MDRKQWLTSSLIELEKVSDQFVRWSESVDNSTQKDLQEILRLLSPAKTRLKELLILEPKTPLIGMVPRKQ
jgi:hypothetical protein